MKGKFLTVLFKKNETLNTMCHEFSVRSTWSSEKSEQSPDNKVDEQRKSIGLHEGETSTADAIVEE